MSQSWLSRLVNKSPKPPSMVPCRVNVISLNEEDTRNATDKNKNWSAGCLEHGWLTQPTTEDEALTVANKHLSENTDRHLADVK